jgi:alpha-tubulin suppressor-like RCC1 family protein
MKELFQNKLFLAVTIILTLSLSGCLGQKEEDAAAGAFNPQQYDPDPAAPGCYVDSHATPEEAITRKLDILIVPDTSGSIVEERAAIADGFDSFISILPPEVDYRIGVMLGHGPGSVHSGSLYQKGVEPIILDSQSQTVDEIKADLRSKMMNPAGEGATDGGEMGIASLMAGLDDVAGLQADGFMRDDAALVVIFVADEQDICAEFPDGVVPVVDGQGKEPVAKADYCYDAEGNNKFLPEAVVAKLKEVKNGYPLVVSGVIYNNSNTIPLGGENEIGYGYMETIIAAGGISVDLASGDYGDGLQNIGMLATSSMAPVSEFNLNVANVDTSSIEVKVNGVMAPHVYMPELNQVHLVNARPALSTVQVSYCEKEEVAVESKFIATGGFHSCAILQNGDVKCWGNNLYGQLGLGHNSHVGDDELPSAVAVVDLGGPAVQLSAGLYHTCALLESGNVRCWGMNIYGQLGYGHTSNVGDDETPSSAGDVSLGGAVRKIFSGTLFNCAVMQNGDVRCWGQNNQGQLGLGHVNNIGDDELPSDVPAVSLGAKAVQMDLSTISNHSCAVLENEALKCWGQNAQGQLGLGHYDIIGDNEHPSAVPNVNVGGTVTSLATGSAHTCALLGSGDIKCWGLNNHGQIGYGIADSNSNVPFVQFVNLGEKAVQIAAGNTHSCALLASNNVMCWGDNAIGQLGYGNLNKIGDDEEPVAAGYVDMGDAVSQISLGATHGCALIKDSGKSKCWGANNYGELGQGNMLGIGDDEVPSSVGNISLQ